MIGPALLALVLLTSPHKPSPATGHAGITYTIRPGDCLWTIAGRYLGDPWEWPLIYDANRVTLDDGPDLIFPGQKIRVIIMQRRPHPRRQVVTALRTGKISRGDTDSPVTAPPAPVPVTGDVPSGQLSCSGLETLWLDAGGSAGSAFLAAEIAMAESGGWQYAHSPTDDYGYWQINAVHGSLATFDPLGNARAAVMISQNGTDWSPWTTYQTGAYTGRC